jgi:hypothetical protein
MAKNPAMPGSVETSVESFSHLGAVAIQKPSVEAELSATTPPLRGTLHGRGMSAFFV